MKGYFRIDRLLLSLIILLLASSAYANYTISLGWISDTPPLVFSVAQLIPGDLSDLEAVEFRDFDPFFQMTVSGDSTGIGSTRHYLFAKMELAGGGDPIFLVKSANPVYVPDWLLNRSITNRNLAEEIPMEFVTDPDDIMPYIDGSSIQDGYYILTVVLSVESEYDAAVANNVGIGFLPINVENPSQVRLELPIDDSNVNANPIFIWTFPRAEGVIFNFLLVGGPEDGDPNEVIESAEPGNTYADVEMEIEGWEAVGDLTTYTFTGVGDERPLEPDSTYFWQVTAQAPGIFPYELNELISPIWKFKFLPPGDGLMGMGGEENPPPPNEAPIITALRDYLPASLFDIVYSQIDDPTNLTLQRIRLGDQIVTLQQLILFFQQQEPQVVLVAVSQ